LYGGNPTEITDSTQNPKKILKIKSSNQNEKFPKKSKFYILKVERSEKCVWAQSDAIGRLHPKSYDVTQRGFFYEPMRKLEQEYEL
jgi:hypothetical protein